MNLFETLKASVSLRQAAEHCGLQVNRNSMARCPFHNDRHPSLKLNENYFYCFGCGEHGDVIDFTARLFHLTGYAAARKLAADFDIDPGKPPTAPALLRPNFAQTDASRREEAHCLNVLCGYLQFLEQWKREYAPKTPEEAFDDHFVEACQMIDYVTHFADTLTFGDLQTRTKAVELLRKDGAISKLSQRLTELQEEGAA